MDSYPVASSARLLRHTNAAAALRLVWDRETFTASDVMADTGLTRSTVLALCDELTARGWVSELDDARAAGEYRLGRPARRYAFDPRAGRVVGVDAGQHHVTASVADLRGAVLARSAQELRADASPATRVRTIRRAIDDAVGTSGSGTGSTGEQAGPVLAVVLGVPAPTDAQGASPPGNQGRFWARMNPGLAEEFADVGQSVTVENDANLAAVAEWTTGAGVGQSSFATLLSGERFGAGLIIDGTLLRGPRGGAGEMRLLDLVEGVGSADGLAHVARELARRAADAGDLAGSALGGHDPATLDAADVLAAAQGGDAVAVGIVEQLADRLARVCAVIASLLDVERIVVGGALAPALGPVVARAAERLPSYIHPPVPAIVASALGSDGVHVGAVRRALAIVRASPFDFELVRSATGR
ncbi:ROK family protein [Promicromonospora sp. NPDC050880]|uniref:ROK family protein n=1 Tax=Promicromonospora sp. NPDC050880 TaxID=3364406 RepID=UPI0037B2C750